VLERALALQRAGQLAGARRLYRSILETDPNHVEALRLLATLEAQRGNYIDARTLLGRAYGVDAESAAAWRALADAQKTMRRFDAALASYERALALDPAQAGALNDRAIVLAALDRIDEAVASFDEALRLQPDLPEARANCVTALVSRGDRLAMRKRHDAAARDFGRALALDPAFPGLRGLLLHARANVCDWSEMAGTSQRILDDARAGVPSAAPLVVLGITDSAQDQAACARTWMRSTPAAEPLWRGERYDHDRIRVAYLSADLDEHAVAYLMAGVFERHDRARFETYALSSGPDPAGGMRGRLKAAFDHFLDVRGRSDRDVAALIRDREIDIVVDLNGHTHGSRTPALALRPAPVAVSYLGFPGTLGADYVDYLIADRFVIPEAQQRAYVEKIVYLPDTFQANDRDRVIASRTPSRAECGLPERGFVFCAFGNSYKITPAIFDAWMRMLHARAGSVLWLVGGARELADNLAREARQRGVDPARLVFAPRLPYAEHLARYRVADLFLDTLPFNGGATVSDALWAGLPVLTCAGEAMAARMAGSLLHAIGLPELVTTSLTDYEALAIALAGDAPRLQALRTTLAQHRDTHPLFDTGRFRRNLEAAYVAMHAAALQ
jgi:predicted O-linked N-acetylglucosamine transferase (SPINDLY family)